MFSWLSYGLGLVNWTCLRLVVGWLAYVVSLHPVSSIFSWLSLLVKVWLAYGCRCRRCVAVCIWHERIPLHIFCRVMCESCASHVYLTCVRKKDSQRNLPRRASTVHNNRHLPSGNTFFSRPNVNILSLKCMYSIRAHHCTNILNTYDTW